VVRHVLVPLDGSALAEAALPAAAATAKAFDARVTLLHVLEEWAPDTVHGHPHLTGETEARAYLDAVAQRPAFRDRATEIHVHGIRTENVADSIMAHADELGANAVIGVRYDANEVAAGVTEVLAYGTAVVAEPA